MAKYASAYNFSHKELVQLMLKDAGIHEGIWSLSVNFRLGAGSFGPSPTEVTPTGFVGVEGVGLQKIEVSPDSPIPPLAFDAALLNPPA